MRRAVAELPKKDQLLLQLLLDEQMPAHVVAKGLGITPDGVRMKKMRVLKRLRKKLAGIWP